MNLVDLIVVVLAVLSAARGWRLGLVGQVFEIGGGFIGLLIGVALGPRIADLFTDQAGVAAALISLFAVFAFLSLGQTAGFLLGHRFGLMAHKAQLGELDSGLGSAFGVLVAIISFWILGSVLVHGPFRPVAKAVRKSALLGAINDVMPNPPNVFAYIQHYLQTSGFPQVFAGLPPLSPPVDLPSNAVARRAITAADQSTVRVVVPACGGLQLGSGWVAAESTVVTNAHVVAGGDEVRIQQQTGPEISGVVVVFDPRTDVAVVHTSASLSGPVLELQATQQEVGTGGATLGYPGEAGGQLIAHRAAVQANYDAVGRDIYGQRTVTRDIYELRSPVRQGDSGGPFVLPNGDVAGVVFAASSTEGNIGYALTGQEVADEVQRGSERTQATSTGDCTR